MDWDYGIYWSMLPHHNYDLESRLARVPDSNDVCSSLPAIGSFFYPHSVYLVNHLLFIKSAYTSKKNEFSVTVGNPSRDTDTRSESEIPMDCDTQVPEPEEAPLTSNELTTHGRMNRWLAPHRRSQEASEYAIGRPLIYEDEHRIQTVMESILCRENKMNIDIETMFDLNGLPLNGYSAISNKTESWNA